MKPTYTYTCTELVINDYDGDMVPNVRWLVPMALSLLEGDETATYFHISEEKPT